MQAAGNRKCALHSRGFGRHTSAQQREGVGKEGGAKAAGVERRYHRLMMREETAECNGVVRKRGAARSPG